MEEDQGESRILRSNLKDEEGSLRLTCGSTQHTSVGAQIQAHPQQSQLELDAHLPGVTFLP